MMRLTSRSARLGLAGSCVFWVVGCGGSDVPDPDSDSKAAQEPPPSAAAPPLIAQAAPAAPAPGPESPAPAGGQPAAVASAPAGDAPAAAAEPPPAAEDVKTEAPSATAELIALSGGQAPAEGGGSGDKPAEGNNPGGGQPGGPQSPAAMQAPGGGMPSNYPGMSGGGNAMEQYARQRGGAGPGSGYPGASGGPAGGATFGPGGPGGGGDNAAPDFTTHHGAVAAFLNALKAKDIDRLAEACAQRAPTEASERYKKMFRAIVTDQSLSAEEIDELAKQFEGMSIMYDNQVKSTGRVGVVVGKNGQGGSSFTRVITTRREKSGWKVVDLAPMRELKPMMNMRSTGRRR